MNYHNITHDDLLNGPGLRVVLWVSGCQHACHNCQNQQTWSPDSGIPFDKAAKNEIFEYLAKPYTKGITFSGGDPLHPKNYKEVGMLIREIKKVFPDKDIYLYTGYSVEPDRDFEISDPVIGIKTHLEDFPWEMVDIIFDGRYDENIRHDDLLTHKDVKWVGSSNQRIIYTKSFSDYYSSEEFLNNIEIPELEAE